MRNVGQGNYNKATSISTQARLDTLANLEECEGILSIDAMSVTHRNADLSNTPQTLLDQA